MQLWLFGFAFVLAGTMATMVGVDVSYREVMTTALKNYRGVSMADVTWDEFKEQKPNPKCFAKSQAVAFKEIDFFVSHSWSDDPKAKWDAVQGMRRTFKAKHKREPIVWFDKYCIDQNAHFCRRFQEVRRAAGVQLRFPLLVHAGVVRLQLGAQLQLVRREVRLHRAAS